LLVRNASRKPEVNEFDLVPLIQHNIFKLDVSVRNALAMKVLESINQLSVDPAGVVLAHPSVWLTFEESVS
jgi:hypothetical protein